MTDIDWEVAQQAARLEQASKRLLRQEIDLQERLNELQMSWLARLDVLRAEVRRRGLPDPTLNARRN